MANARRLALRHGSDLRYWFQGKTWFIWDERRWKADDTGEIERRAKDIVRSIYIEAANLDKAAGAALEEWAWKSEAKSRIDAMIHLGRSEPHIPVTVEQLDRDPWLFNCLSGTIDLRTGELRSHSPDDLITKLAPVEFNPDSKCPLWDRFLLDSTGGNQEFVEFLQRAVGYSLTGDVSEEILFFVHGPQATGKSTFLEAVKGTLGDYAMTADFEAFLKRKQVGGPRNDIARLAGSRMVISIEVEEGKHLAEGLVKMLTGGDTVTARFLYREAFEFPPSLKLWIAANHAPNVTDEDAIWRRILRVPLDRTVPKEKRDPGLKATLKNSSAVREAILAWAVRGCLAWQQEGLRVPSLVTEATQQYREQMDTVHQFLQDRCSVTQGAHIGKTELLQAYAGWFLENGDGAPLSRIQFNRRLEAKGFRSDRIGKNGDRVWTGITLKGLTS